MNARVHRFLIQSAFFASALHAPFLTAQQVHQSDQAPVAPAAQPIEPLHLLWLTNVHRDRGEQGHGEGYSLFIFYQGQIAAGGIMELEGSQIDPEPTCLMGELKDSTLRITGSAPGVYPRTIEVHGQLTHGQPKADRLAQTQQARNSSGYVFRGTIRGGIYESAGPVVLRQEFGDKTPEDAQEELQDESCACEWNKYFGEKSFTKDQCKSPQSQPAQK